MTSEIEEEDEEEADLCRPCGNCSNERVSERVSDACQCPSWSLPGCPPGTDETGAVETPQVVFYDDDDCSKGLDFLRQFASENPDIVSPALLEDDVDVSLEFAQHIVAHLIVTHCLVEVTGSNNTTTTTTQHTTDDNDDEHTHTHSTDGRHHPSSHRKHPTIHTTVISRIGHLLSLTLQMVDGQDPLHAI